MIRSGRHYPGVFHFQEIGYGTRRVTLDHYPGIVPGRHQDRAVMISGDDPRVAEYAENFEELLEDALSAEESIKLMRNVADDMS